MRLHWNGSGLVFHELCHIIHQFALSDGLNNSRVRRAYERARSSRMYENVRRRDWAGKDEDYDLAYAMVNLKEFFSEMSVTYWSRGYASLDNCDQSDLLQCSPPIIEQTVLDRIRDRMPEQAREFETKFQPGPFETLLQGLFPTSNYRFMQCNKFYPFTSGQLKHYDPATYEEMEQLWREIARWDDTIVDVASWGSHRWCWATPPGRRQPSACFSDTVNL
jgi:hypothetical protein